MSTVIAKNVQIGTSGTATDNFTIFQPATPDGTLRIGNGNTGITTSQVALTSAGNVGIGTASPSFKLDVSGTGRFTGLTQFDNAINLKTATLNYVYFDDALAFSRNGTGERMRIDTSGNVGIGTSSPSTYGKFGVVSGATYYGVATDIYTSAMIGPRPANDGTASFLLSYGAVGSYGTNMWKFDSSSGALSIWQNANQRLTIDNSGRLLVGTTSAPGQTGGVIVADDELFVYNIPTTASGANCHISSGEGNRFYRSTSALKYKQDIRDLESIDINAFRPVRYKSKCENDDQTKDHFGFIADEAAEAGFEELVSRGVDGEVEGFQYDRMTVVLLKAIQELKAIVDAQGAEIAALKGQA